MNRRQKYYQLRKDAGVCTECGTVQPRSGSFKCQPCLDKIRQRVRGCPNKCHYASKCKHPPEVGKKYCREHLDLLLARAKTKRALAKAGGSCSVCGKPNDTNVHTCTECRSRKKQAVESKMQELRDRVYAEYGGYQCYCCGETHPKLLTIDHVNNDGAKHRKELGGTQTRQLYNWIISNDFPKIFQVACWNCNVGRHLNGGVCPHHEPRTGASSDAPPSGS